MKWMGKKIQQGIKIGTHWNLKNLVVTIIFGEQPARKMDNRGK
jgi:hypothetical protein